MTAPGFAIKDLSDDIEKFVGKRSLLFGDQDKGRLHLRRPHILQAITFSEPHVKPLSHLIVLI